MGNIPITQELIFFSFSPYRYELFPCWTRSQTLNNWLESSGELRLLEKEH